MINSSISHTSITKLFAGASQIELFVFVVCIIKRVGSQQPVDTLGRVISTLRRAPSERYLNNARGIG